MRKPQVDAGISILVVVATISSLSFFADKSFAQGGTWSIRAPMSTRRSVLGVAAANGKIWAVGGTDGSTAALNSLEMYDPVTNTWQTKAPMQTARSGPGVAVLEGNIYVIGGSSATHFLKAVEMYDPLTDTWVSRADLPKGKTAFAAAALGGKIYAFPGVASCLSDDRAGVCDHRDYTTLEYNPATNSWTPKPQRPPIGIAQVAVTVGTRIYIHWGGDSANIYAYDPIADTYEEKRPMNTPRVGPGHTELNGRVYVMGGEFPQPTKLNLMEEYDPASNISVASTPMPTARAGLGAASLNGKIYAVGGGDDNSPLANNEEFTPDPCQGNCPPIITSVSGPTGPLVLGTFATVTANFIDADAQDSHTCTFSWDDNTTSSGIVTEPTTSSPGICTGTHTHAAAGVYTVGVTVTDNAGASASATYEFIVVYDPSAGFVTGGGWINSPAGAYRADLTLTGKANFGFVSKYKQGATVPDGQTEFQFKAGNFNFKSSDYEWLVIVVAGAKAQYKGRGTVNGTGDYGFLLTATDGQLAGGGGLDKFRIKVWDRPSGAVVYDNVYGSSDDMDAANPQVIGGGSIVIHK